jgi:hypothetical protein
MSWVVTAVIIAIVVLLFTGGASVIAGLFKNFAKFLKDSVGFADTIFTLFDEQLNTCKKNGFWRFWKGCIIGIGAFGYGMAVAIGWMFRTYIDLKKVTPGQKEDSAGAKAKIEADRLNGDAQGNSNRMAEKGRLSEKELLDRGYTYENDLAVFEAVLPAVIAHAGTDIATEANSHIESPAVQKANAETIEGIQKQAQDDYDRSTEDLSPEDREAADTAAEAGGMPVGR